MSTKTHLQAGAEGILLLALYAGKRRFRIIVAFSGRSGWVVLKVASMTTPTKDGVFNLQVIQDVLRIPPGVVSSCGVLYNERQRDDLQDCETFDGWRCVVQTRN